MRRNGNSNVITEEEQRALIALANVPGLGPNRIRPLLAEFRSAQRILSLPAGALQRLDGVGPRTAEAISSFSDWDFVDEQVEQAEKIGARFVSFSHPEYPERLRHIFDPPPFLWVRGHIPASMPALAVVGSRKASSYGLSQTRRLTRALVEEGFLIVSGLAYGVDAAAHKSALEDGGYTVGVLGSGVDRIYPSNHHTLAHRMMEQGAVVSEFPLGTDPDGPNFPKRNRIISGMTAGTLVAEAFDKGGALITARLALEQNREVFAMPGRAGQRSCRGTNLLIQRGHAKLVMEVDDVLEELQGLLPLRQTEGQGSLSFPEPEPELPADEGALYEHISDEPVHIDELCRSAGVQVSDALVHLLNLEMKGLVRQEAGRRFVRD